MTVLGPVEADQLGVVLPHEHLVGDWARMTNNFDHKLDDVELATRELGAFAALGGKTLVELTNLGAGRDPAAIRDIATATGLHIVLGCGWYREPYLPDDFGTRSTNELAAQIVRELEVGIDGTEMRAGIIGEIGARGSYLTPSEERSFRAAARAHLKTGITITTHALESPVGLIQLDLLEEERVDPRRVIIGHCDRYPHPDFHEAIARRGAWVQFDTIRGRYEWDTARRVDFVMEMRRRGFLDRVLLSHDNAWKSHLEAYGGGGYAFVLREFLPRLVAAGVSDEEVVMLTELNPRRAISGELKI